MSELHVEVLRGAREQLERLVRVDPVRGHEQAHGFADLTVALEPETQRRRLLPGAQRHERHGRERSEHGSLVGRPLGQPARLVGEDVEGTDLAALEHEPVADRRAHGRLCDDSLGEPGPRARAGRQVGVVLVGLVQDRVEARTLADLPLDLVHPRRDVVGRRSGEVLTPLTKHERGPLAPVDEAASSVDDRLVDRGLAGVGVDQPGEPDEGVPGVVVGGDVVHARHPPTGHPPTGRAGAS